MTRGNPWNDRVFWFHDEAGNLGNDMEEELLAWIDALRATNLRVTRSSVQRKAIELA